MPKGGPEEETLLSFYAVAAVGKHGSTNNSIFKIQDSRKHHAAIFLNFEYFLKFKIQELKSPRHFFEF